MNKKVQLNELISTGFLLSLSENLDAMPLATRLIFVVHCKDHERQFFFL